MKSPSGATAALRNGMIDDVLTIEGHLRRRNTRCPKTGSDPLPIVDCTFGLRWIHGVWTPFWAPTKVDTHVNKVFCRPIRGFTDNGSSPRVSFVYFHTSSLPSTFSRNAGTPHE